MEKHHHHQQEQYQHHHHHQQQEEQQHHHHKQDEQQQQHHHHHHHHRHHQQEHIGYPIILAPYQNPTNISLQNSTNHPKPQQSSGCVCHFSMIAFLVVIILFLTLPSHHRNLKFELDSLSVNPFNISNNSSNITTNWNVIFSASDFESCHFRCKHHDSYYDSPIEVSIFYNNAIITNKVINSPFSQYYVKQHKRVTHANTGVSSEQFSRSIADAIVADLVWSPRRTVNFAVTVKTIVQIEGREHHHDHGDSSFWQLTASCEQVSVGFSSDDMMVGTMLGGSRTCKTSLESI